MNRLWLAACGVLLSGLLVSPVLAGEPDKGKKSEAVPVTDPLQGQGEQLERYQGGEKGKRESAAGKRQKDYRQKRDAMKQRRDEAEKVRARNIENDDPGQAVIQNPAQ